MQTLSQCELCSVEESRDGCNDLIMQNQFKMQEVPFLNAQIIPFHSVSEKHRCVLSDFFPPPIMPFVHVLKHQRSHVTGKKRRCISPHLDTFVLIAAADGGLV